MTTTAIVRADLVGKLLARALDGAAMIGEAENAAVKMVHIARRENIGLPDLMTVLAIPMRTAPKPRRKRRPPACRVVMKSGKYGGMTLADIGTTDIDYLQWISREWDRKPLRDAAAAVLEWLAKGDDR